MKYLLLILAWSATAVHRLLNNLPPKQVNWFLCSNIMQDRQWYICDSGNMLSVTLILTAALLFARKDKAARWLLSCLLTISIIDIIHYWVCFKQSEIIPVLECTIMLFCVLKITLLKWITR